MLVRGLLTPMDSCLAVELFSELPIGMLYLKCFWDDKLKLILKTAFLILLSFKIYYDCLSSLLL
jgi:hypothetical protein